LYIKDRTESFNDYFRVERKGAANYNTHIPN
jgi:hypothetical protein